MTLLQAEGTQADPTRDRCYQPHQCSTPNQHVAAAAAAAAAAVAAAATAVAAAADENSGLHPIVAAVVHQSHTAGDATARHHHTVVPAAAPYQASPPFATYHQRRPSTSTCSPLSQNKFSASSGPENTISCLSTGAVGRVHVLHAWSTP